MRNNGLGGRSTHNECEIRNTYTLPVIKPSGGEEWFEPPLVDVSLHGMYHLQIEEVTYTVSGNPISGWKTLDYENGTETLIMGRS